MGRDPSVRGAIRPAGALAVAVGRWGAGHLSGARNTRPAALVRAPGEAPRRSAARSVRPGRDASPWGAGRRAAGVGAHVVVSGRGTHAPELQYAPRARRLAAWGAVRPRPGRDASPRGTDRGVIARGRPRRDRRPGRRPSFRGAELTPRSVSTRPGRGATPSGARSVRPGRDPSPRGADRRATVLRGARRRPGARNARPAAPVRAPREAPRRPGRDPSVRGGTRPLRRGGVSRRAPPTRRRGPRPALRRGAPGRAATRRRACTRPPCPTGEPRTTRSPSAP
ncbi:hypothetical protein FBY39_0491 [Microbacterium sp. SLBN-146]|nr:hypothetical protein FBY39_0491 [Microbacterium sp. SLBN-146]